MNDTSTNPPVEPKLTEEEYDVKWLRLRNEQLHRRIAVLEEELAKCARLPSL